MCIEALHPAVLSFQHRLESRAFAKKVQSGFTLIEMIMFIVIVSVALVGVLSVMNLVTKNSADPMVRKQSMAFAEAVLEEILLKDYSDPDGSETGETRATYDDVMDYNGLTIAGTNTLGASQLPSLSGYSATISVTTAAIGPSGNTQTMRKVQVTVTDPLSQTLSMVGYRASY